MLTSIHPLGERSRDNRWWRTVVAHIIGTSVAGSAIGAFAGGTGAVVLAIGLPVGVLAVIVVVLAAYGLLVELTGQRWSIPSIHRQVNEDWIGTYRGWVYGFGFGVQLGFGVATIVTTALVYLLLVIAVLSGSVVSGAAIGLAFGAARGATVLAMAGVHHADALTARFARLHGLFPHVRRASLTTLATSAALIPFAF